MYLPETYYLVCREQHNDRLREIEHQRLLRMVKLETGLSKKLYREAIRWLGIQMIKWGKKLQNYDQTAREILTTDVSNHRLKYL
jgi:hypothetical protein